MNNEDILNEQLTAIIIKFQNHSSIVKIKCEYKFQEKKYFRPVPLKYVEIIVENFPNNKASGGATPLNFFKQSCFT